MLDGYHAMALHFRDVPPERNLPMLMVLLAIWNNDFLGASTLAVLPYAHYLSRFPAYLQQLAMESNGKQVTVDGEPVGVPTAPVVWGEAGTNRSEEHTSELQSLMRLSYAVFCLKKKK